MSFFSKLLGGTFESNRDEGDAFMAEGSLGEAKLAYERALKKADKGDPNAAGAVRDKIAVCRRGLAENRIREADELVAQGDIETAGEKLADAVEICDEPQIAAAVEERKKRYQASIARMLADEEGEMSEEELLAVIAGTWTDSQADEYAALPDPFRDGLLAAHDGDHATAIELMERALAESDLERGDGNAGGYYVHLELGLEKARAGLNEAAIRDLGRFAEESEGDDEAKEKRVTALAALSRVYAKVEKFEEAEEALVEATRAAPGSAEVWMALGVYRRGRSNFPGSVEALERAVEVMGTLHPNFAVVRELGLTYLAAGKLEDAEHHLFAVVEHAASQSAHEEMDPLAALPLAGMYEAKGQLDKAASLMRHLAVGHDVLNHFTYNAESARLLAAAGEDKELVRRYLDRAEELAKTEDQTNALAALREKLGAP